MKNLIFAITAMVFLAACSLTNEHDAATQIAKYKALTDINIALNKPNLVECDAKCTVEIARENKITFTAQMLQDFTSIDRMIDGGFSFAEIIAKGVFSPATLQAYATYKSLEVVSENSGTRIANTDSYNSHSEANQANQQATETVSGIKAGESVDQSQHNQNNPITTENIDNNSITDSNNSTDNNSTTEIKEAAEAETLIE